MVVLNVKVLGTTSVPGELEGGERILGAASDAYPSASHTLLHRSDLSLEAAESLSGANQRPGWETPGSARCKIECDRQRAQRSC